MYVVGHQQETEPSTLPPRGSRPRAPRSEEQAEFEQRLARSHFGLRLLLLGALPLACVVLAASLLLVPTLAASSRDIRQDLMNKAQTGISELRQRAEPGLAARDADLLQRAARRYIQDGDVALVQFLDNDGKLLFSHTQAAGQPDLDVVDLPPLQVVERAGDFAVWANITHGATPLGRVELSLSKSRLTAANELPGRLFGVGIAAGLLGLGLAWIYVRRHILPVLRGAEDSPRRQQAPSEVVTRVAISRGQEARLPKLAIRPCSLYELLRGSLALLDKAAQDKHLELHLELSPGLPDRVLLDEGRLRQVLLTLAQNAISSTDSGWVKLHADAQNLSAHSFELRIRVEDTRSDPARQRGTPSEQPASGASAGSELGLTMARELVLLMQGTLSSQDSGGSGSFFQFVIPVARLELEARPESSGAAATSKPPPLQLRLPSPAAPLLLVDPDQRSQLELVELIENLGFEIEAANTGQRGIECFLANPYALILVNCAPPERAGYDTARAIRAVEAPGNRVPIIACIPQARAEERAQMLASGMDDYLLQPLTRDALCRALAEWLPEDSFPASSGTRLSPSAAKHAALRQAKAPAHPLLDLGSRQRSERTLELFMARVPDELRALARAAEQARRDEVASRARALKANCLRYGATKMAAACALLEGAHDLSEEQLEQNVKALDKAFSLMLEQVGETIAESDAAPVSASGEHNPDST
jgi:signal transduction histidine kinase/CheY-like chemotaxis protein/HPt (histidine-containing phosphotransfer) domain-containing protein